VLHPVVDPRKAISGVLQHTKPDPGQDLGNVVHDDCRFGFEVPFEVCVLRFLERELKSESDQRILDDLVMVGAILPEVDEKIVPTTAMSAWRLCL
jgi:hypothetical protein